MKIFVMRYTVYILVMPWGKYIFDINQYSCISYELETFIHFYVVSIYILQSMLKLL